MSWSVYLLKQFNFTKISQKSLEIVEKLELTETDGIFRILFWNYTQTRMYPSSFPGRLCLHTKKYFRIKVWAGGAAGHISAMRQAARAEDEAADWSLGQEEWSIWSAILQNELFVLIHLSGKIKTIKYVFPVSSSFTTCRNLPKMWTIISMSCKSFGTQIIFSYKKLKIFVFGPQPWNQYMACKK